MKKSRVRIRWIALAAGCVACGGSSANDEPADTGAASAADASAADASGSGAQVRDGAAGAADSSRASLAQAADGGADAADSSGASDATASGDAQRDSGAVSAPGVDAGPDAAKSPFVLSWQDDFNTLDTSAWQLETFTYAGNEALFSTQNANVAGGILTISLTPNPGNTTTPYLGVEMRSIKTLTYGKVSASMRFAHGSGVVSGLVLFYTPFPNCNWNEIDIEHLGGSSNTSQLNAQVFTGTVIPQCTTSVSPTQDPLIVNLGVNAETAFHQYDIEWTPQGIATSVDGAVLRTWTKSIALMDLPQNILLTIWASATASWAGPLQANSAPTSADVDWIKVYAWQP